MANPKYISLALLAQLEAWGRCYVPGLGSHPIEMASFTCKRVLGPMSGFAQRLLVPQCPFPEPSLLTPIRPLTTAPFAR